jgi:methionyl-tRNA synthetase
MARTYYITTPIYYVNDVPHIGHSYTTVAADAMARHFRSEGRDVRLLTGTDEHGIKIVKAAARRGVSPRALADEVVGGYREQWKLLNIQYDDFIRTSEPRHEKRVQALVARLVEKGEIYPGQYEGWYDEGQEEFVTESTARQADYKSAITGKPLTRYSEKSYFFRLARWTPKLVAHIEANEGFIQPVARRNEVLSKLAQGVEDLSISRPIEKLGGWGIPMPNDPSHSVYVWIDALSNYYTALGLPPAGDEDDGRLGRYWPADVHLIGKDILWFHAVYWPCMLMALDLPLPRRIFAHGWWTADGKKMSKSLGNFISRERIEELCAAYSADVFRYYLLRAVPFGQDGDFSADMLKARYNQDLANGVGNLLSRTVNMIGRYFDGRTPAPGPHGETERGMLAAAGTLAASASGWMEACQFHSFLDAVLNLADATNRYIDVTAPFKLAKDPAAKDRLGAILYNCAEAVRLILLYLRPFMPETAAKGLTQIGWQAPPEAIRQAGAWGVLRGGEAVTQGAGLFPRKA